MKLQVRDWLMVLLFVGLIFTNWSLYMSHDGDNLTHQAQAESWVDQQVQIDQLKACIDEKVSPCELNPNEYDAEQ